MASTPYDPRTKAFTLGFRQGDEIRHAEPLGSRLAKRLLEAARFRAVASGILPAEAPCRGTLLPVGGPPAPPPPGARGAAYFAQGLCVRLRANGAAFERELDLAALRPWAAARVASLSIAGVLDAGEAYDMLLAVGEDTAPRDRDPYTRVLPPLQLAADSAAGGGAPPEPTASLHGRLARDHQVRVRMPLRCLDDNLAHCRAEPHVERAGVFVGRLRPDATGAPYVSVHHFLDARHTTAAATTVQFTRATWGDINRRMVALDGDLGVVGWSHSHPHGAAAATSTALFMSSEDVAIMAAHFDAYFHFALVVDPTPRCSRADSCAVFGWDRSGAWLEQRSVDTYRPVPRPPGGEA